MSEVPDELNDLYEESYAQFPVGAETRRIALRHVLERHEQMVRRQIAEEIEAEQADHERTYVRTPTPLGSALWVERQKLTRVHAAIARGDSDG